MNFKLGIKDDLIADCTDVKQVLERVRGQVVKQPEKASELTDFEIKQLIQRTGTGGAVDDTKHVMEQDSELIETVDKIKGIGFEKQHMVSTSAKGLTMSKIDAKQLNQIQGMNTKDLKYLDHQKKLSMINFLTEKIKRDKEKAKEDAERTERKKLKQHLKDEARKDHKHVKLDKKEKDKHKRRHRSRSRSSSIDRSRDYYERRHHRGRSRSV